MLCPHASINCAGLTAGGGGTGISNPSVAGILLGSYAGGSWQQLATSSLGISTSNVTEGTNLFYTDTRVNSYIHGSSTIPKTYTTNTFSGANTFNSTFTLGTLNGPLQAVNGLVSASSTLSIIYGGTGTSTAPSYGNVLVGNARGGYDLTATSSLGIPTAFSALTDTFAYAGRGGQLVQVNYGATALTSLATSTLGIAISDTTGTLAVNRGGTGQASFGKGDTLSILQVVENPGWLIPYISCVLVGVGLIVHFTVSLRRSFRRREAARLAQAGMTASADAFEHAGGFLAAKRPANLRPARANVHIRNSAVAARRRQKLLRLGKSLRENRARQPLRHTVVNFNRLVERFVRHDI